MSTSVAADLRQHISSRLIQPRPDCLIWPDAVDRGYGRIWIDGKAQRVHRVVWELENGPIPEGLTIDHLCRVRYCCNTAHMELVTAVENSRRRNLQPRAKQRPTALKPAVDPAERVMDHVETRGDCWIFTGATRNGFGRVWVAGEDRLAHRVMWEHINGPTSERLTHTCGRRECCNPSHLRLRGHSRSPAAA